MLKRFNVLGTSSRLIWDPSRSRLTARYSNFSPHDINGTAIGEHRRELFNGDAEIKKTHAQVLYSTY